MRKIILATAAVAFLGMGAPAFADMTLPVGSYSQATGWGSSETGGASFNALADQDHAYAGVTATGHRGRLHHSPQR